MVPLKDTLPTDRVPLVTIALIVATVVAYLLADDGRLLLLLANGLGLWIFGISVEDSMARWRYVLLCALGAGAAVGLHAALDPGAGLLWPGATGVVATVVAAHLSLYARARVFTVAFVVVFFGLYELPAWLIAGVWAAAQAALALTGGGDAVAAFAWVGAFALGLALARPLADRRKSIAHPRDGRPMAAVGS